MTEQKKYAAHRSISEYEINDRPGKPSQVLREIEATLIGELARSVALADHQFDGWPSLELVGPADFMWAPRWELRATVAVR